jgi:hypothetical protein
MFALNLPSIFGHTIDCRINGKPKRVTWRDEHTLVIEADPYATGPVDIDKFGASWTGLEALASQLRGDCTAGGASKSINLVVALKNRRTQQTAAPKFPVT